MEKTIKIVVDYPWPGIEPDIEIVKLAINEKDKFDEEVFNIFLEMIELRGITWYYEAIDEE